MYQTDAQDYGAGEQSQAPFVDDELAGARR